ncbi:CBS domain-containing protein [Methanobacterium alcaliphilum]|uniref:CBS domain-containing protein n=1 Tax=Methanobacterium alcaliphilum TaxID=392018 RepID=UPI00200A2991|nr:CBS domain-containing protein [Methanobacterium alcaliphilum]MCK9151933.1 CBS domain-containing protein [Methanobacterium alcaliphilum]
MIRNLYAQDIMITDVIVSAPEDLVAAANLKMVRTNIGGVPVVKESKLIGLITHRDILLAGGEALKLKVEDLMSKNLVVVSKDTHLKDISKIMADTGYQRIPVVEDEHLIGLITQSCIIKAVADYLD